MRTSRITARTRIVIVGGALLLGATSLVAAQRAQAGGIPRLQLRTEHGVRIVSPDERKVVADFPNAVANPSGSFLAVGVYDASSNTTMVRVMNGWTGKLSWEEKVEGRWRAEAVTVDGNRVALGDPLASKTIVDVPIGRQTSRVGYITFNGSLHSYDFPSNVVAEAFVTAAPNQVVYIEHMPIDKPTYYLVRVLNMERGVFSDPLGRDKRPLPLEVMKGTRFAHAWSTNGTGLYTLYETEGTVFVHSLDLTTGRSACLAVPEKINAGGGKGGLAYSPSTNEVVVAGPGGVTALDASTGNERQSAYFTTSSPTSVKVKGNEIFIANGSELRTLRLSTLDQTDKVKLSRPVRALESMSYPAVITVDTTNTIWWVPTGGTSSPTTVSGIKRGKVRPMPGTLDIAVEPI